MALTMKQKKFCEGYLKYGNATRAAKEAGYSAKTATFIGAENLRKPQISAYIAQRQAMADRARIADTDEVLEFYSRVMRGEEKDQFGLDASLADRIKAGNELMKRFAAADPSGGKERVKVIVDV